MHTVINKLKNGSTWLWLALVLLTIIPWWTQGVMCDDELMNRLFSLKSFFYDCQMYIERECLPKGRLISVWCKPFATALSFLGADNLTFKILQIQSILLDYWLFAVLIYRLFRDRRLAALTGCIQLVYLPITFELTVPNAYNTQYNYAFALLIWAMIEYVDYLHKGGRRRLFAALIAFLAVCTAYELFITYALVFILICIKEKGLCHIETRRSIIQWTSISAVFLVLYKVTLVISPTSYGGTQLGSLDPRAIWNVLYTLFRSCIPGYWLVNDKYRYLLRFESERYPLAIIDIARISALTVLCGIIVVRILKGVNSGNRMVANDDHGEDRISWWTAYQTLIVSLMYMFIPSLPQALSAQYQKSEFIASPVTFFLYFPACLALAIILCKITDALRFNMIAVAMIVAMLCAGGFLVQRDNTVFANAQKADFERLQMSEEVLSTPYIESGWQVQTLYSDDLFMTRHTLAIRDSYYTIYLNQMGSSVQVINGVHSEESLSSGQANLYIDESGDIVMTNGEYVVLFSRAERNGEGYVICNQQEARRASYEMPYAEGDLYIYAFHYDGNYLTNISPGDVAF